MERPQPQHLNHYTLDANLLIGDKGTRVEQVPDGCILTQDGFRIKVALKVDLHLTGDDGARVGGRQRAGPPG